MTLPDDQLKGLAERLGGTAMMPLDKGGWALVTGDDQGVHIPDAANLLLAILERAAEMGPMKAIKVANEIQAEIWSAAMMKRRPQFLYAARTALMQLPVKP